MQSDKLFGRLKIQSGGLKTTWKKEEKKSIAWVSCASANDFRCTSNSYFQGVSQYSHYGQYGQYGQYGLVL